MHLTLAGRVATARGCSAGRPPGEPVRGQTHSSRLCCHFAVPLPPCDSQGGTASDQIQLMTNGVCGTGEEVGPAKPPTQPDPWALAAHVAGGRSPFDFVEPPIWFSYSSFETFDRCPRQYAFRYLCHLPAEEPRPAAEFGSAAHGAFAAFTRERRERTARGEPERGVGHDRWIVLDSGEGLVVFGAECKSASVSNPSSPSSRGVCPHGAAVRPERGTCVTTHPRV